MNERKGQISVNTENIFPIIRKWLYSDQDIFLREVVSNACDAISKYDRLKQFGEAKDGDASAYRIDLVYDREEKSLSISDNGIGMTEEEVNQYINQIAFSGAMDFVEKYKDKTDGAGIIGHFGLGFYSVFMVSEKVELTTLSYQEGAQSVRWESEEGQDYVMKAGDRQHRGTTIKLYFDQEAEKLFDGAKLREILHKYCQFMPYPIYFVDTYAEQEAAESRKKQHEEALQRFETRQKEAQEKGEDFNEVAPTLQVPEERATNNTHPLWLKSPKDCSDEDYLSFYQEAFHDFKAPLFWIHLNMDYPFNLKGILYFPQYDNKYETLDGRIKLYNNQVFVADNIKEVIPDFLFLLKGVLDCPDLPLNVSRSFLQSDQYVKKLSEHIVRKVADRLSKLFKDQREDYTRYWKDIEVFVKYACLREEKFYERVQEALLFKTSEGDYKTLSELGETIYYVSELDKQALYIRRAQAEGKTVVELAHELDPHWIQFLEHKRSPLKFVRVDALDEAEKVESEVDYAALFTQVSAGKKLKVDLRKLGTDGPAALLQESEESRRLLEMRKQFEKMQGTGGELNLDELFPVETQILLNHDHALIQHLEKFEEKERLALAIYRMAQLAHGSLDAESVASFVTEQAALLADLLSK